MTQSDMFSTPDWIWRLKKFEEIWFDAEGFDIDEPLPPEVRPQFWGDWLKSDLRNNCEGTK